MDTPRTAEPPDFGINVPCNKSLSLSMLLNFLKSDCPPTLLDILKTNTAILLECSTCRNIFRDLANFLTHRIQFCPAEGSKRRVLNCATLGLESASTTKVSPKECSNNNSGAVRSCCPASDETMVVQAKCSELKLCDESSKKASSAEPDLQPQSKSVSQSSTGSESSSDSQVKSSCVSSSGTENKTPQRSRLDRIVSQLREKSGSLSNSVSFLNLNQNVANATTHSDSSLDPPSLNSMRNEQHRSAYNSEPSNAPAQHDSNLTVSGSRHKPYHQTTENFSAVISFAQSRCLICRKVFQSRKNLVHHARIHHRDLLLKVNGSRSLSQMAAHPFPCKICGHTFQWRSSLWRHTKEKHSRLVHSSINTIDDFNSSYQSSFLDSLQGSLAMQDDKTDDSSLTETSTDSKCQVAYSEPLKPFSCDYCSVRFSTPKARRKHVKSKHPENYTSSRKSAGILLDLSSKEYDQMLQQTLPNPPGVYPCPDCGAEFRIKSSMISHRARKHNNASVEPRATSSNKSETSSTSTGFSCSVCGQTFPLMLSLKVHASKKHGRPKTEKPSLTLELKPEVKIPKPPTTVANHNYETKSASRARAFVSKQHSLEITDKVVATSEANEESPRVIEATSQRLPEPTETYNEHSYTSTESSKIVTSPIVNSTSSKSKSRTPQPWVNPRLAEYMQICDLDTFTCSICDLSFDDRKKLFLHLNRVHLSNNSNHSNSTLTISSIKKEIKEVAVDDAIDLNDVNVSSGSAGTDNSQPQAEVSSSTNESSPLSSQSWSPPNSFSHKPSSRKIRNYSKICNFETLSCKLCPRMCNTMSQLQNHAVYKHMDMIELVPMRDETHFGNQSSENSSNHLLRVNSPVEEQSSLDLTNKKQDDSRILGLSMTGVKRFPKPGDKRPFDCTRVIDENQNAEEEVARKDNEGMAAKKHSGSKIRVK